MKAARAVSAARAGVLGYARVRTWPRPWSKTPSERWQVLVGATGFEPATPCTPCKCATRLRHAPTEVASLTIWRRVGYPASHLAAQQLEDVLELGANLPNDLLTLARIGSRLVTHEALAGAAD